MMIGTDSGIPMKFHSQSTWNELDVWVNIMEVDPLDAIKSAIIERNSDFYSFNIEIEKSEKFIVYGNNFKTLELLESLQNFDDEAEVFHYFLSNKGEFNSTNAYSLVKCFQSFKSQNLKDILVDKFWGVLILDLDLIDYIHDLSINITLQRLANTKSEVLYEISSISQSPKILDSCKEIIEIRNQNNNLNTFMTAIQLCVWIC